MAFPPIFDGHNDTLLNLHLPGRGGGRSFFERSDTGHIDLPRAREGGFGGGFFAVFVPNNRDASIADITSTTPPPDELPPPVPLTDASQFVLAMMARLFRIEAESGGQVCVVRTADELETCLHNDVLAAILHIEGAEAIDTNLDALHVFYQAGLRSLGPVWSRANNFGEGVPFKFPSSPNTGAGLTDVGKALVRECNQLGILVDLSHITEKGFWDVAATTTAPLVATHSNVHALCPSPRNLTDKQLDAIKESEGMVGLNFAVGFLREDGQWGAGADTPITTMVEHIQYMAERMGIDCVGFGSDFDGARVPADIKDVSGLPRLLTALSEAGFDDNDLQKLAYANWLRVLRKTWGS